MRKRFALAAALSLACLSSQAGTYWVQDNSYTSFDEIDYPATFSGNLESSAGRYQNCIKTVFTFVPKYTTEVSFWLHTTEFSNSSREKIPWLIDVWTMTGSKALLQVASGGNGSVSLKKGQIYKIRVCSDNIIRFASYQCDFHLELIPDSPPPTELSISPSSATHPYGGDTGSFAVDGNSSWTVSTDSASWITLNTTSGSSSGTVSYRVSQNTGASSRTGEIVVQSGSVSRTFTVNQGGNPTKPDLLPYAPKGWGSSLMVSTSASSTTGSLTFKETDALYSSWAFICRNRDITTPFTIAFYVDGALRKRFSSSTGLKVDYYVSKTGLEIGSLSPGRHEVEVVVDDGNAVAEANENNNRISVAITVTSAPKPYTVRFIKNTGSSSGSDAYQDQVHMTGKTQRLLWLDSQLEWNRSAEGYEFLGWSRSPTATGATYSNGQSVSDLGAANSMVTLYAIWRVSPKNFIVRFHSNCNLYPTKTSSRPEETRDQVFKVGQAQHLLWKDSQLRWSHPDGNAFLGWSRTKTSTSATYANGENVKDIGVAGTIVDLYAVWKATTYTVRFNRNDGSGVVIERTYSAGATLSLPWINSGLNWATPSGWSIVGWAKSASATSAAYANGAKVPALGTAGQTINLYVVWKKPVRTYTVRFNSNDGSGATATQTFVVGQTQHLRWKDSDLKWATPVGDKFLGWSETKTSLVATYENGQSVKDIGSAGTVVDLYAVWQSVATRMLANRLRFVHLTSVRILETTGRSAPDFMSGAYSGEFADGTGTFDLLLDEDGTAFFAAWTEDGDWAAECVTERIGETLLLTFESGEPIVMRLANGSWVAE